MGTLMLGNVEGTLRGQTGAGGRAGRLDGWVGGWMKRSKRTFDVVFWNRGVAMGLI